MRRPSALTLPLLGALLVLSALIAGCGKQEEGERCDPNNGSLDCESGLECKRSSELNIGGIGVGLCCPSNGVQPSTNACLTGAQLPPDVDFTPTPDAGPNNGGSGDGGA